MMGSIMNDGKHCPVCGKDIGVWAVLKASWPTRVRCPHCKTRLSYGASVMLPVGLVAFLALLFYVVTLKYRLSDLKFHLIFFGLAVAILLPFELTASFYLRRRGILRRAN